MKTIFVVFTVCWAFTAIAGKVWRVETWTGNIQDADTDAGIFLYIVGIVDTNEVIAGPVRIDGPRNNFQKGQRDTFNVTTKDVGNLKRITIFNDGVGDYPGWLLSKIVVEDVSAHRRYEWTPNEWILDGETRGRDYSAWFGTPVTLTKVCDPGWYYYSESEVCYKYFYDRNFTEARSHCAQFGGHIAMPKTIQEHEFLYSLKSRSTDFWIGLSDIETEGSRLVWEDGSRLNMAVYGSYFRENPNVTEDERHCVQLVGTMFTTRDPTYDKKSCDMVMDYVCEINRVCNPISQSCYTFFSRDKNYTEARDHCTSLGGHLPMPKNEQEDNFLYNIKPYPAFAWLGLTEEVREGRRRFVWDDGEPLSWAMWATGEPNNRYGGEHCVQMQTNAHNWNDVPCSKTYSYFCVKDNAAPVLAPTDHPLNVNITEDILATLQDSMDVIMGLDQMPEQMGHERSTDPVWETYRQEDRIRLIENDLNAITEEWREVEDLDWSGYVRIPRKNETHIEMLRGAMIRYPELFPYDHERLYYDVDVPENRADYLRYRAQNALRDMEKAHVRLQEIIQRMREQGARGLEPNA